MEVILPFLDDQGDVYDKESRRFKALEALVRIECQTASQPASRMSGTAPRLHARAARHGGTAQSIFNFRL